MLVSNLTQLFITIWLFDKHQIPGLLPHFHRTKVDEFVRSHSPVFVVPANAGFQGNHPARRDWTPAFAGVTALETF